MFFSLFSLHGFWKVTKYEDFICNINDTSIINETQSTMTVNNTKKMNEIIVTQMSTNYYGTVKKTKGKNKQKEYKFVFLIYFYELLENWHRKQF